MEVERMTESLSKYRLPTSQMEDVPIGDLYSEKSTESKPQYVKPKGKLGRYLEVTKYWDFFMHYKVTIFTAIMSILLLLLFSISVIYMIFQSVESLSTLSIDTTTEEKPVPENNFFQKDTTDRYRNILHREDYKISPDIIAKPKKREIRKIQKRQIQFGSFRNVGSSAKNERRLQRIETGRKFPREVEIIRNNFNTDVQCNNNHQIHRIPCKRNAEYCQNLLAEMQSVVENTGESVKNLNEFLQKIRHQKNNDNPQDMQDLLQCVKCKNINDKIVFSSPPPPPPPSPPSPIYSTNPSYRSYPIASNNVGKNAQMKKMSAISALLDSSDTDKKENKARLETDSTIIKNESKPITYTPWRSNPNTANSDPDFQKNIENANKSQIVTGGSNIHDDNEDDEDQDGTILETTTIMEAPNTNVQKAIQGSQSSQNDQPELTSDSSKFSSSASLYRNIQGITEKGLQDNLGISPAEQYNPKWNQGNEFQPRFQERYMPEMRYQEVKSPNLVESQIAEITSNNQPSQHTPFSCVPYFCLDKSPMSQTPTSNSGMSRGLENHLFAANQFPISGFARQDTNQRWSQEQFPQRQGVQFRTGQQSNMPLNSGLPVGPSRYIYVAAPMFQLPAMTSRDSEFQTGLAQPQDLIQTNEIPNSVQRWESIGRKKYPGHDEGCTHDTHRCLDGSKCVATEYWCDGIVNCRDASDETNCSCRDVIGKNRICDGYFDCPRGEDEIGCFGCPEDTFCCRDENMKNKKENCIPITQRCDGSQQCRNGKDEVECNILSESYAQDHNIFTVGYTAGYLYKNWKGRWYPVCAPPESWATEACELETGSELSEPPKIRNESIPSGQYQGPYLYQIKTGEITVIPSCSGEAIFVNCPALACGMRFLNDRDLSSPYGEFGDTLVASPQNISKKVEKSLVDSAAGEESVGSKYRVVGGNPSQPKSWPFLVTLNSMTSNHGRICGGVIISEDWILTAGHCVEGFTAAYCKIQAGLLRRRSFSPMTQTRRGKYIQIHPAYESDIFTADIALIKLDEPLRFNRWIQPACLPSLTESYWENHPLPNTSCITVGWGQTIEGGPIPDHLHEAQIPISPQCTMPTDREANAICAGLPQGGRDTCYGDSGGPLMCERPNSKNQWYAAGIISHGQSGCAQFGEPGVYTRVSLFVKWIQDTMRDEDILLMGPKPLSICPGYICPGDSSCLPKNKRCNRKVDCLGAEDEKECSSYSKFNSLMDSMSNNENQGSNDFDPEMVAKQVPDFLSENEKINKTQNEPNIEVTNVTTSKATAKQSVFTIERNESSSPNSTLGVSTITTLSTNDPSLEQPISTTIKSPTSSPSSDAPKRFICTKLMQTIPISKRCNRIYDCEDGTDENNCSCKDYLANFDPSVVCDGYVDCHDGSDEKNCTFCEEDEFVCSRSRSCVSKSKVCDDNIDCPYKEDELDCFALTSDNYINIDMDGRPQLNRMGVVTNWKNDEWRPICQSLNDTLQVQLSNQICDYLGFGAAASLTEIEVRNSPMQVKKSTNENVIPYEYPPPYEQPDADSKTCQGLYIECRLVLSTNVSDLIVEDSKTRELSYLWPWEAIIFVDGRYRCPSIILEPSWLLASAKCVRDLDLRKNYTVALLGAAHASLYANGPHEQLILIDSIEAFKEFDAVLMHLKNNINATRYVQPLFVEKRIFPAAQQDVCLATGVNGRYAPKTIFFEPVPDQCLPCHRCYKNYRHPLCTEYNIFSDWSGIIVCQGSGIWYPAAIYHEEDLFCGLRSEQTLTSIDSVNAQFTEIMEKPVVLSTTPPPCDGFRCPLGDCISLDKVCDGIPNCRDGYDENTGNCEKLKEACDNSNSSIPKIGCKCTKSELRCGNGQCVPKEAFCDFKVDCEDRSDETEKCTCADYLKLTAPERLCDNVRHCLDKTDENHEICPCKDRSFKCSSSGNSSEIYISPDFVCDGEKDCSNGEDESKKNCRTLKGTSTDPPGVGEVLRCSFGECFTECFSSPVTSDSEISDICKSMGYNYGKKIEIGVENNSYTQRMPVVPKYDDFYMVRLNNRTWISMRTTDTPLVTFEISTEPCYRVIVNCT